MTRVRAAGRMPWRETHERERIASYAPELRDMVKRLANELDSLAKLTQWAYSDDVDDAAGEAQAVAKEARALLERVG